jgi:hypothetical protein
VPVLENGLLGEYFNNADLTGLVLTRTDGTVDFTWGNGSPDPSIGADTFSVRWTGYVLPAHASGALSYTFRTSTNDGVRLWVDGQLLVDDWTGGPLRSNSGSISLNAGEYYPIDIEFYENTNTAEAHLFWGSPQLPEEIVPAARLFMQAAGGGGTE